jgi:hypothetical protein
MFKTGDKILIISILIIAAVFIGFKALQNHSSGDLIAVITQDGELIEEINLTELEDSMTIMIDKPLHQVILAENGKICFYESDCPNQTCVHSGWLTKAGDKAVCLPSKVIITIEGEGDSEVDTFSY